jgi:hypothetical protein
MQWMVSATPWPLYPLGKRPVTCCTGGWVGPRAGLDGCGKSRSQKYSISGLSSPVASRYTDCAIPTHNSTVQTLTTPHTTDYNCPSSRRLNQYIYQFPVTLMLIYNGQSAAIKTCPFTQAKNSFSMRFLCQSVTDISYISVPTMFTNIYQNFHKKSNNGNYQLPHV